MERKVLSLGIVAGLLLWGVTGTVFAGVEPSPFQPEINKLHSIELQVAAINKRVAKLTEFKTLPEGATNYLSAMANQMQGLKLRLEEVLLVVPQPSLVEPYIGQEEVVFALDSIRIDSKGAYDIVKEIASSHWGVEPSPFLPLFNDVSIGIIHGINIHLLPVLDPILPPLPLPLP
jgi:hypothetical protein